ncbi:regulator of microtubule dynamics protein 1 isoform X3 [Sorex araneus]|uniref:regulator of microtubule dynamics protein 1 isoform X3 n=1 Tax=Sorex araneus TaxID=42254 RepID=UPI002433D460|nr:regulator of microtubule dynamics protein 1 isoform X3 [Sorex araneus]
MALAARLRRVLSVRPGPVWRARAPAGAAGGGGPGSRGVSQVLGHPGVCRKSLLFSALSFLGLEAYQLVSRAAVVHAAVKVVGIEEILEQADYLYESGETKKLYQLLTQYTKSEDAELLWRLARVSRDMAQLSETSEEEKKLLVYEALEYAKRALEKNELSFAAHKWYAICINDVGDYEGIKAKIANAYIIKEHFEALGYFQRAEQVDPNFYSKNLLLLGKTYLKLNNKKLAAFWLMKAKDYPAHTEEDRQIQTEASRLLTGFGDKN